MLQIIIEHHKDETVSVQKICNDGTILAEMQDNNSIDLDVCTPYIGEEILVHHNHVDDDIKSYTLVAKLESVEIDPVTQVKCIKYSPKYEK